VDTIKKSLGHSLDLSKATSLRILYTLPHKVTKVLVALAYGLSFNRFEAEEILHDYELPTTVNLIQEYLQVTVSRHFEIISKSYERPEKIYRYWLTLKEQEKAITILRDFYGQK
jgi:hypothetical protein